ncbi:succinyl-diaminopimelate desuccinylase [Syntrophus gentianae]|uniref:Succinyl-diaminopimelate desuccinylase n=1 Tax=Syntrophus gentianae TaxID=43775 RepID=A0A1H7XEV0_9BACT|nr:M20 family metallo-hydrolase [Syntrophus gentianae]SEM31707.1 succinyl-diaminopimelate desuccinylase [Syntrophus gentianae]
MIDHNLFQAISRRIDAYEEEMIEMQRSLTGIPALSPDSGGEGEYEKARYLKAKLKEWGFQTIEEIDAPDSRVPSGVRPNVFVTLPGRNPDRTVWLLTHLDIVPPGELRFWDHDPYQVVVKDRLIFGRGTEDNQQDMVASIFAAKAFIEEGIQPESSIGLAFVADEETGSLFGLDSILKSPQNPFRNSDLIVVPDAGNEEGTLIEVAEKSILWLRFKTTGKQCHGSKPQLGRNALLAASHLIVKLTELYNLFSKRDVLFDPPVSTFEPTRKDANVPNINTIPGEDIFFMDCRVLPDYSLSEVLLEIKQMADAIQNQFGVEIEITSVQENEAAPPTSENAPVIHALKRAIADVYSLQAVPQGIGGGTVAAHFRKQGYPVAVWSKVGQRAHQPNECCSLDTMLGNAKVFAHLFLQT